MEHTMRYTVILIIWVTAVVAQYESNNEDAILPYNPPGMAPPPPPTDPPGYDGQLTNDATQSPGLRAPPLPSWTHQAPSQNDDISPESSGLQPKVEETISSVEEGNKEETTTTTTPAVLGSGDDVDGSGSGSSGEDVNGSAEGSAEFWEGEASGADETSFTDIMHSMDSEAEALGVNCPTDIIFVVDATSSLRSVFDESIKYLEKVIEGLDIAPAVDHVGAMIYSSEKKQKMKIRLGQHEDMGSLMKDIDELPFYSGITATGHALSFAANHTEGRRENLTLNYVILTDGYSYDLIESGAKQLRAVPNSNVYAVTIGDIYLKKELEMITGNPDNVLYGTMSYGTLVKRLKFCAAREQARLQHDENPGIVLPGEFLADKNIHRTRTDASFEANDEGVIQNPPEELPVKDCRYDIGIIFDSSGSLMQNFKQQLLYANKLVDQMPVSENNTRVGIVQFAGKTKTRVLVDFKQNKSKEALKSIIEKSPFYSGTTFTNQALKRMTKLFEDSSRDDSKCKLVLFTDGYSAEDTDEGIEALKSRGVEIYTVGISTDRTAGLNMNELRGMATSPEHYYDSSDFSTLLEHFPSTQYCS